MRAAEQTFEIVAPERAPPRKLAPQLGALRQIGGERRRLVRPRFDAERLGDDRPDVLPDEHIAVRDVEGLVARRRRLGRPDERTREQPRVDRLQHIGRPAGVGERQALLLADRRVGPDRRNEVHRRADDIAEHHLWPEDGHCRAATGASLAQVVLLKPVEIVVRVARRPFARRHGDRPQMHAVGLGALQQRDMTKRIPRRERFDEIAQHRQIGGHLLARAPSLDQVRPLLKRRVDQVRDLRQPRERLAARRFVHEVERQMSDPVGVADPRAAPGNRHRLPALEAFETGQRGLADDARRAGDQDPSGGGPRHSQLRWSNRRPMRPAAIFTFWMSMAPPAIPQPKLSLSRRSMPYSTAYP